MPKYKFVKHYVTGTNDHDIIDIPNGSLDLMTRYINGLGFVVSYLAPVYEERIEQPTRPDSGYVRK